MSLDNSCNPWHRKTGALSVNLEFHIASSLHMDLVVDRSWGCWLESLASRVLSMELGAPGFPKDGCCCCCRKENTHGQMLLPKPGVWLLTQEQQCYDGFSKERTQELALEMIGSTDADHGERLYLSERRDMLLCNSSICSGSWPDGSTTVCLCLDYDEYLSKHTTILRSDSKPVCKILVNKQQPEQPAL